jgi:hypothetical protein
VCHAIPSEAKITSMAHVGVHPSAIFLHQRRMPPCEEYDRLHTEVENVLGNLAQVSTLLVDLFRSNDLKAVHRLDKELELTLGAKERCIGALSQHVKDHQCVTVPDVENIAGPEKKSA